MPTFTPPTNFTKVFLTKSGIISEISSKKRVKVEDYKITPFSGITDDWPLWKDETIQTLIGAGDIKMIEDEAFARRNQDENETIYALIAHALQRGHARHIAAKSRDARNEYQLWPRSQEGIRWRRRTLQTHRRH